MMTQQLGVSILTAPLAAIDRRTLSQAWYSALHLAHERSAEVTEGSARTVERTNDDSPLSSRVAGAARVSRDGMSSVQVSGTLARREHRTAVESTVERRSVRSPLARRIERMFLDPARRTARASFTLEGTQARVHVALQAVPSGLRLIALCPPAARERVVRALDQARYALAARGVALLTDVREVTP
jgi:hypothetical protein